MRAEVSVMQVNKRSDKIYASNSAFSLPTRLKSKYEWRIIGLIMLKMQADFGDHKFDFSKDKDLKDQKPFLDQIRMRELSFPSVYRHPEIEIQFPLSFLLSRNNENKLRGYDSIKEALSNLAKAKEYENKDLKEKLFDKDCKDTGIVWGLYQIIENPEIRKYNGENYVYFRIPDRTWKILCNWKEGVHIFELSSFFKFECKASYHIYILLADHRKKGYVVWSTNYIKDKIAPGEYRDYSLFRKRVLNEVAKDLKEHSPFYIEFEEYVDIACTIPSRRGRGYTANYVKVLIFYQPDRNPEVDKRIDLFLEMNPLTSFKLDDLTDEEKNFLKNNLGFDEIKGKNLVTIIKLKYYKNYGHESAANIWRTNPGNFFMEYLKRLYDTIMLSEKEIKSVPAYAIKAMQEALATYEPSTETEQQIQEKQDSPKQLPEKEFTPSHEQDLIWLSELCRNPEWRSAIINTLHLKNEMILCGYVMMFRDENICHPGHNSKQDLSRHFMNIMRDGENRDGWVTLFGYDRYVGGYTEDVKNDPIVKDFGFEITYIDRKRIDYKKL